MRIRTALVSAVCIAGLTTGPTVTAAAAATCAPSITKLQLLAGAAGNDTKVLGLGYGSLSAGVSGSKPVYWTGTTVHALPLPAGYTGGEVKSVNIHNLMVGQLTASDGSTRAFRYQAGHSSLTLLNGSDAVAVNDSGRILGVDSQGVVVWIGTLRSRYLAAPGITGIVPIASNNRGEFLTQGQGMGPDGYDVNQTLVWPATAGAAPVVVAEDNIEQFWTPVGIADNGTVAGGSYVSHSESYDAVQWIPPYGDPTYYSALGREGSKFTAVSDSDRLQAGTAFDTLYENPTGPDQSFYRNASGATVALPGLTAGGASYPYAAADNGRIGGDAVDAHGVQRAVIWGVGC